MGLHYKNGDRVSDSVGLLISILVRYPEVGTINFEPEHRTLRFTFLLSMQVMESELEIFRRQIISCLETFCFLHDKEFKLAHIDYSYCEDITLLEIKRDVNTLTSEEISLIITILRDYFAENLTTDSRETDYQEEIVVQEDIISKMLDSIRYANSQKRIMAFREEGKVLVFKK